LYAATERGVTVREIAETIGRHLDVPDEMSYADTRRLVDRNPVHPGLIAGLEDGHRFTTG
jgi:hypothetical protein